MEARELAEFRDMSGGMGRGPPSAEMRTASTPFLSEIDVTLGLRFRGSKSEPSNMPGPADFLGGFTMLELETGG